MTESGSGHFNFASVSDSYRKYLQPAIFDAWALELLSVAPPGRGDVVLDVASGTGAVAHAAVAAVGASGRVIASDISPLMLTETGAIPPGGRAPIELLE
jgi:ubiquinone/menaquinone biosynthesis C-methylase UbiE